jgi:hypothetical protein
MGEPKVTKVRIEYEDGSAHEVVGVDDCEIWRKICDGQAWLWASRGWSTPTVNWKIISAPVDPDSGD